MLLIGLIAFLYASLSVGVALIPMYFIRRDSRLYRWVWGVYLAISVSFVALFVSQWTHNSSSEQSTSNWGTVEGPITVLGDFANNLFNLTVLLIAVGLMILFRVSGWGHPRREQGVDRKPDHVAC